MLLGLLLESNSIDTVVHGCRYPSSISIALTLLTSDILDPRLILPSWIWDAEKNTKIFNHLERLTLVFMVNMLLQSEACRLVGHQIVEKTAQVYIT